MRIGKYSHFALSFVALPYSNEKHNNTIHVKILKLLLYRIARRPDAGGRGRMFTAEQETHIVNMVMANNSIRLREIQQRIIEDDTTFQNIHNVSISVLSRLLARNRIRMKQIYRVPYERNSERVKQLRYDYVQVSYSIIGTESGSAYCAWACCAEFVLSFPESDGARGRCRGS